MVLVFPVKNPKETFNLLRALCFSTIRIGEMKRDGKISKCLSVKVESSVQAKMIVQQLQTEDIEFAYYLALLDTKVLNSNAAITGYLSYPIQIDESEFDSIQNGFWSETGHYELREIK
ncbi:hypothetical protein PQC39_gp083 [Vibrio phage Vp_R1]|uniref:Uncharacterized protein n=1 Tax=Vibrio phage Vp_R1 TaxID=2059867 RepID=A0A2H5BQ39_9CAUD|nr:hypothetical protein PQC39_gp083 [Vibrio phage Vp_R1]AUG88447.1 hypothetical protein VPR_083 [Vibrio phage Vp_R1]